MKLNLLRIMAVVFIASLATPAWAQDKSVTLSVDDKPALTLKVSAAARVTSTNGYLRVVATNVTFYVWAVPNAKTVDDALPRTAEIITNEFVNFKTTATTDVVVAGAPAKRVAGSGNEADDDDPGNAVVVFFAMDNHVFAACVHGEDEDAFKAEAPTAPETTLSPMT